MSCSKNGSVTKNHGMIEAESLITERPVIKSWFYFFISYR